MSFTLVGPFPLSEAITILPNPQFGNSEAATSTLNILRTLTGKRRTYVKSRGGRRKFQWDFTLTRNKAMELLEFYRSYHAQTIFIQDHNERRWVGNITNNPFEIEMTRRGLPSIQGWPVGETCTVTMEFEGIRTDTTLDETGLATRYSLTSQSELSLLSQNIFMDAPLPTFGALQNNWDALNITGVQSGTLLNTWPDSGPAGNNLVGSFSTKFNLDKTPTYDESSPIFNNRPVAHFSGVSNGVVQSTAAMNTQQNMSLFPGKRGTIFWVLSTTAGIRYRQYELALKQPNVYSREIAERDLLIELENAPFCSGPAAGSTEFGVWALQDRIGGSNVEQLHFSGVSSPFTPVNLRFQPTSPNLRIQLTTSHTGAVCALNPNIFTLQRSTDTNIRFRTNGIERSGTTILNNPPRFGKFLVNDQAFVPQFTAVIQSEWAQILVYKRALRDTEIAEVENYLSLRWGIPLGEVEF